MSKQKKVEKIILNIGKEKIEIGENAIPLSNKGAPKEELLKAVRKAAGENIFPNSFFEKKNAEIA